MVENFSFALAQINPKVGDIKGNASLINDYYQRALKAKADLVIFPELALIGYPPEDLIFQPNLQQDCYFALQKLSNQTLNKSCAILLGAPWFEEGNIYNSAIFMSSGHIQNIIRKVVLPNYGIFDDKRLFQSGNFPSPINYKGINLGVMVCEDIWSIEPAKKLKEQDADILIVSNASPFDLGKKKLRLNETKKRVVETSLPLIYVNQIGGQDDIVFDGGSFVLDKNGDSVLHMTSFNEEITIQKWNIEKKHWVLEKKIINPRLLLDNVFEEEIYQALVLGLKDYIQKNNFSSVLLGLSGGIDSALTAAIAVDALGSQSVHSIFLPSPYTSQQSFIDAKDCADNLGIDFQILPIEPGMRAIDQILHPVLDQENGIDITHENIQSRLRGLILMALSNKTKSLVLTTGNKSEMAVGYATLYGDMCGAFNVLKDVYKTMVYRLVEWRNTNKPDNFKGPKKQIINSSILHKAPTAELRPNQKDQDSLPPYDQLDDILHCIIELNMTWQDIVKKGHSKKIVQKVWYLLDRAEYKRRQSAPGVKITPLAFGRDRRYPITNGYKIFGE
ncbi:MAG: NAD+ synthase [Alphaproteobacteria bacterium]|nr:NAD+ synthase [Alphaproteobacteria bacterium]